MKRFHVHVSVDNLEHSIAFYSAMFGSQPTITKPDYAKWALDDPRVNFAISHKPESATGLNHLGIQAETADELGELNARLNQANIASVDEATAQCCYAESDKHWTTDPSGIPWEAFHTMREIAVFGQDRGMDKLKASQTCCPTGAPEVTLSSLLR